MVERINRWENGQEKIEEEFQGWTQPPPEEIHELPGSSIRRTHRINGDTGGTRTGNGNTESLPVLNRTQSVQIVEPDDVAIKKRKDGHQLMNWVFTIKKDAIDAHGLIENLSAFCDDFIFQGEKGEGGYEHWQGYLHVSNKNGYRLAQVKNQLGVPSAHLKPCKDRLASKRYCSKEETRIEGPYDTHYAEPGWLDDEMEIEYTYIN